MKMETLKQQILTAKGDVPAELVLKNARVINVFTNEIEQADVAICQGIILGVGHYTGETELDLQGKYVCPGLVDGHIHIESSMLCGPAFEQAVLPHGTTAVVTDPHEISNVAGTAGLDFMLETTKDLALSVYFMLPSCVPATGLDESGAVLEAEQLRPYYQQPRVLGLAELMNSYGTVRADEKILQKICDCTAAGKKIDGHAPFLSGEELNAYVADLIVLSDLEQFTVEQVYKKGKLVAQQGKMLHPAALAVDKVRFARVFDSFNMDEITPEQLQLKQTGTRQRVICLTPHSLLTTEKIVPFCQHPGTAPGVDVTQQIVKLAVFERHQRSGHVGLGFLGNYGLQCGAVASSIAHDSHNLIVAGTNDADMVLAGNTVRKNKGGLAFALNGQVVGELPLPVAGLMSTESAEAVEEKLQALKAALKAHGISEDIDAFMTLAFVSLPVIPKLRLNTYGIVDVDAQQIVPAVF